MNHLKSFYENSSTQPLWIFQNWEDFSMENDFKEVGIDETDVNRVKSYIKSLP
jgi:hypothetical protein